jgi:hypothetical protein
VRTKFFFVALFGSGACEIALEISKKRPNAKNALLSANIILGLIHIGTAQKCNFVFLFKRQR